MKQTFSVSLSDKTVEMINLKMKEFNKTRSRTVEILIVKGLISCNNEINLEDHA